MSPKKLAPLVPAALLCLLAACEREAGDRPKQEPVYGDPVGIQMAATQDVPAFEIVVAVTKGVEIDPLVPPLSGLIHKAIRACPGFVRGAKPTEPAQIVFTIEQGKVKGVAVSNAGIDSCFAKSLSDQAIEVGAPQAAPSAGAPQAAPSAGAPAKVDVMALVRFGAAGGRDAGAGAP